MKSDTDDVKSRGVILDAAERIFATHGYEGASMRLIAQKAGVAQALLHYHFKTKDQLHEAIFSRRSTAINAFREAGLELLFARKAKPTLEEFIDVLFRPSPASLGSARQPSTYFAPMVSAISIGEDERSKGLMTKFYDPIARRFIAGFRQILPGLSETLAVWAYLFALGARIQTNMQNGRASRLSGEAGITSDEKIRAAYVCFIAAGIRAMAEQAEDAMPPKRRPSQRKKPLKSRRKK